MLHWTPSHRHHRQFLPLSHPHTIICVIVCYSLLSFFSLFGFKLSLCERIFFCYVQYGANMQYYYNSICNIGMEMWRLSAHCCFQRTGGSRWNCTPKVHIIRKALVQAWCVLISILLNSNLLTIYYLKLYKNFNISDLEIVFFSPDLLLRGVRLVCLRQLWPNLLECHNQLLKEHHINVVGPPAKSPPTRLSLSNTSGMAACELWACVGTIYGRCCNVTFSNFSVWHEQYL